MCLRFFFDGAINFYSLTSLEVENIVCAQREQNELSFYLIFDDCKKLLALKSGIESKELNLKTNNNKILSA